MMSDMKMFGFSIQDSFLRIVRTLLAGSLGVMLWVSCGPYKDPLKTCVVCDHPLGENGGPVVFVHENQEVKVCGEAHKADFLKEPQKHLKKIKETKVL
jgi:hypothetical protein